MSEELEDKPQEITPTVNLTDDDKLEFFKAFMADKAYEGIDKLFNGQLTVKFRSLTVEESADIFTQLKNDQATDKVSTDGTYMMSLTVYRLAIGLISINDEPFQSKITKATYKPENSDDSYVAGKAAVIKSWPVFKLSAFAEAFKLFEDKILALTKAIQDENFWPAAQ